MTQKPKLELFEVQTKHGKLSEKDIIIIALLFIIVLLLFLYAKNTATLNELIEVLRTMQSAYTI